MTVQLDVLTRNARLDAVEAHIGPSPILRLYTGTKPANTAAASTGVLVAEMTLPTDWSGAAANGLKNLLGTWQDLTANNDGLIGYFRMFESTGVTCKMQGDVTITGGGGDMTVDNPQVEQGQEVRVTSFTMGEGNA